MSNEMLGKIMRLLVTVKAEWLGTLADLLEKLASPDGESWLKNLKLFLRKEPCQWGVGKPAVAKSLNTLILVDRTVKPTYPDWLKRVVHPELELQGPAEYDLSKISTWVNPTNIDGWIAANRVYAKFKEDNNAILKTCLTLRDGEEIKKNGVEAFRKFFKGKSLCLWGSVVQHNDSDLYVPYLYAFDVGTEVEVGWYKLSREQLSGNDLAGFFASQS